jgi:hypothetical protein
VTASVHAAGLEIKFICQELAAWCGPTLLTAGAQLATVLADMRPV